MEIDCVFWLLDRFFLRSHVSNVPCIYRMVYFPLKLTKMSNAEQPWIPSLHYTYLAPFILPKERVRLRLFILWLLVKRSAAEEYVLNPRQCVISKSQSSQDKD